MEATSSNTAATRRAWFCIRAQPKHEHIAAGHLRQLEDIDVFLPRIRFRRATRTGVKWFNEPLFPNYLFAQFDWAASLRAVIHARGVSTVIHFGERWPTIHDDVLEDLQRTFGAEQLLILDTPLEPGEAVSIAGGALHGLRAVVNELLPGCERVRVLLDFLGRQTPVEVPLKDIVREQGGRRQLP